MDSHSPVLAAGQQVAETNNGSRNPFESEGPEFLFPPSCDPISDPSSHRSQTSTVRSSFWSVFSRRRVVQRMASHNPMDCMIAARRSSSRSTVKSLQSTRNRECGIEMGGNWVREDVFCFLMSVEFATRIQQRQPPDRQVTYFSTLTRDVARSRRDRHAAMAGKNEVGIGESSNLAAGGFGQVRDSKVHDGMRRTRDKLEGRREAQYRVREELGTVEQ
jgi:hypothetical protein